VHVKHDTGPNRSNREDWSADSRPPALDGIQRSYHVSATSRWPLIRVTIRHHYILCSWQWATSSWLSICVPTYGPLSLWLTNCVLTLIYIILVMISLFFLFVSLVIVCICDPGSQKSTLWQNSHFELMLDTYLPLYTDW